MPRSMTMNGHHTEATAPLDLRVTVRQRGGGEDSVKDRYGDSRVTAEVSVESPAALRTVTLDGETRTHGVGSREHPNVSVVKPLNDMGNPARSDSKHSPMARSSSPSTSRSPKWTISSGETVAAHRRVLDRSSSSLPFRKRQFPTEGQSQHDKPGVSDCLTPERDTGSCHRPDLPKVLKRDEQKGKDCALRSSASAGLEETEPRLHGFTYSHYPRYPVYDWSAMSPLTHSLSLPPSLAPPLPLQAQQLLEDIALATHQDEDGDTALHIAVVKGEELLVCRLIYLLALAHKDLDTNNNLRQTPLHLAVITNQPPLVEALLRAGADSGALDRHGQTVLHLCCEYGQLGCLAVVLSQASPPSPASYLEIRNFEGLTPLHLAVQGGHKELARLLLDAGADINAMDIKSGQSPLMHAVESSNADMVHFLIENVCDVNGQSYSGNTALHSACGRGQVDTVRLLLKSGADSSLKNYHNDTPVMVARNKRVTDVLRGKGPKQAKTLEQQSASASPQTSTPHRVNGSVSPNSSLGRSRSTTPLLSHHSASQSPRAPPTSSPHSQSTDSLSSRQSPMGAQEREPVRLGSNVAGADLLSQGRAFQLPLYLPALHQSPLADSHLGVLMPSHPAYSTPGAPGPRYPDAPYILLSHQVSTHHPSQMNPRELRPLSRGSDQSDISTMSVSSGGKVDS